MKPWSIAICTVLAALPQAAFAQDAACPVPEVWSHYDGQAFPATSLVNSIHILADGQLRWNGRMMDYDRLQRLLDVTSGLSPRPPVTVTAFSAERALIARIRELVERQGCEDERCVDAPNLQIPRPVLIPPPAPTRQGKP